MRWYLRKGIPLLLGEALKLSYEDTITSRALLRINIRKILPKGSTLSKNIVKPCEVKRAIRLHKALQVRATPKLIKDFKKCL